MLFSNYSNTKNHLMYSQKHSTCTLLSGGTYSPNCKRLHVRTTPSIVRTVRLKYIHAIDLFALCFSTPLRCICHPAITCDCLHMRCIFALYLSKSHSLAPVHLLSGIILPDSFWHGRFINAPLLQVFPRTHHQPAAQDSSPTARVAALERRYRPWFIR